MSANQVKTPSLIQGTSGDAAGQLAELQLLARADQHDGSGRELRRPPLVRGGSTLMLNIEEHPDEENTDKEDQEDATPSLGSSSFTALLAASRRLAGSSPTSASSTGVTPSANCLDSPRYAQPTQEIRARRPTALPTLSEEYDDPATEDDSDSAPRQSQKAVQSEPLIHTMDSFASDNTRGEECDPADPAFEEMLEQLHFDLSFLALSVPDLTVRNLLRARDAIACSSMVMKCNQQDGVDKTTIQLSKMRLVRTMMSLDTLRLFLLRYEEEEVLLAVTDAVRRIYDQYARDHGANPLTHSHCVLTASNVARVVLFVRDTLEEHAPSADASKGGGPLLDNNRSERSASPVRSQRAGSSPTRSSQHSSPKLPSSPPRHAAPSSPYSPGSPLRRSILASDGAHVLMSEKLAAYQHRGDVNRLPSFKVRRESAVAIEEASRRRQRSIHYGNEATKALRG